MVSGPLSFSQSWIQFVYVYLFYPSPLFFSSSTMENHEAKHDFFNYLCIIITVFWLFSFTQQTHNIKKSRVAVLLGAGGVTGMVGCRNLGGGGGGGRKCTVQVHLLKHPFFTLPLEPETRTCHPPNFIIIGLPKLPTLNAQYMAGGWGGCQVQGGRGGWVN